jgi:hypothetical protein
MSITDECNSDHARTQRRSLEKHGSWEYKDPLVRVGNAFMDLASMEDTNSYYATLDRDYKHQFADVFRQATIETATQGPEHCICLKDETKSVDGRMMRVPPNYHVAMKHFLMEIVKAGRLRPSHPNPTLCIVDPRVVHDYRALNELNENTVKDQTPLPRQDAILQRMVWAFIRGKIDLKDAFY